MAEENSDKKIDIFNFAICSNLNNFSSKKKTLKREIYENRVKYGKLSKLGIVLDEVRYFSNFEENVKEIISNEYFMKKTDTNKMNNPLINNNNDDIQFSFNINSHRRKYKLQSMLNDRLHILDKINKEIEEIEQKNK
jgi:hypothetical protein